MTFHDWAGPPYTPKKVAGVAGAIAAVLTAGTLLANAFSVAEPYWIATRGFVRENASKVDRTLAEANLRQIGIEIRIEEAEHRRIRGKISDLELELQKNPDAPEGLRRLIQEQIEEQKREKENKEVIIHDLRRVQRRSP